MKTIQELKAELSLQNAIIKGIKDNIIFVIKYHKKELLKIVKKKCYDIFIYRNMGHTLEETGKKFGVTRERIRQIEAKIEEILRVGFTDK